MKNPKPEKLRRLKLQAQGLGFFLFCGTPARKYTANPPQAFKHVGLPRPSKDMDRLARIARSLKPREWPNTASDTESALGFRV